MILISESAAKNPDTAVAVDSKQHKLAISTLDTETGAAAPVEQSAHNKDLSHRDAQKKENFQDTVANDALSG